MSEELIKKLEIENGKMKEKIQKLEKEKKNLEEALGNATNPERG